MFEMSTRYHLFILSCSFIYIYTSQIEYNCCSVISWCNHYLFIQNIVELAQVNVVHKSKVHVVVRLPHQDACVHVSSNVEILYLAASGHK